MVSTKPNLRGLFAGDWATESKVSWLAETFTIFSSLQKIAIDSTAAREEATRGTSAAASLLPSAQTFQYFHRISGLYRDSLKGYIQSLERSRDEEDATDMEAAQSIGTILHFVETLYVPADGRGVGVVGEEVLHWLNTFDFAPRTQDGQKIAQSAVPYQHPSFWDYTLRCVLRGFHTSAASLLSSLTEEHPSKALRTVAEQVCQLLSTMPRSTSFTIEHDFLTSRRRWIGSCRSILNKVEQDLDEMEIELERLSKGSRSREDIEDERLEFEAQFRCLLELMIGVKERVFEACDDWREALGAWGVLVQPSLKRDDIPQVVHTILDTFPIDATLSSDLILSTLAQGDVRRSCLAARDFDPWLAAHMTDLLQHVGVLEAESNEEEGHGVAWSVPHDGRNTHSNLRNSLVEEYAETVLDDQGLWRLAVDYLAYCGAPGKRRTRHILLDVPLAGPDLEPSRSGIKGAQDVELEAMAEEEDEQAEDPDEAAERRKERQQQERDAKLVSSEYRTAMEVIQTCIDLGLQDEAQAVCKRMSTEMMKQKRVGPALAYCVRARDSRQIQRIVDDILWLYIDHGLDSFCNAVDSIPMSLLTDASAKNTDEDMVTLRDVQSSAPLGTLSSQDLNLALTTRLVFLARYRDFHRLYGQGDLRSAATLLVELVASNAAPEPFRAILLVDAIPLLQSEHGALLSAEDSFELLRVLETVAQSSAMNGRQARHFLGMLECLMSPKAPLCSLKVKQGEEFDREDVRSQRDVRSASRRLDILRLALARHLAQTVIV